MTQEGTYTSQHAIIRFGKVRRQVILEIGQGDVWQEIRVDSIQIGKMKGIDIQVLRDHKGGRVDLPHIQERDGYYEISIERLDDIEYTDELVAFIQYKEPRKKKR